MNTKVTRSTLNGQKIVVISQSDGSSIDIANTGPAFPLLLTGKGSSSGQLTLHELQPSGPITAPPASQIFDATTATPSPTPAPTPAPARPPAAATDLIGAWTCTTSGTGGGNFTLNPDHIYSVVQGVNGTWSSSGNQIAFAGGTLNLFAGTVTGNSMALTGNGRSFSCLKH